PQHLPPPAPPAARRLALGDRSGVVVLAPGRDLLQQVLRAVAGGDAQHDDPAETIVNRQRAGSTARSAGGGRPEAGPDPMIRMHRCDSFDLGAVVALSGLRLD